MKRSRLLLLLAVLLLLALALVACGNKDGDEPTATTAVTTANTTTTSTTTTAVTTTQILETPGLRYTPIEDGAAWEVSGYEGTSTEVVIPSLHENKPVKSIGVYAFQGYNIRSVTIGASVESIENDAFRNCEELSSVTLPDSVRHIGHDAFEGCTNLSYTTYESAIYLGNSANPYLALIKAVDSAISSVTIHADTRVVCDYAFRECLGLRSVIIPDAVVSIGREAFIYCFNLISVTVGSSVESIGDDAFQSCLKLVEVRNLSSLTFTMGLGNNGDIAYYALDVYTDAMTPSKIWETTDGYLFYEDGDVCYLLGYTGEATALTLPAGCHGKNYNIYRLAFYGKDRITSVTIGSNVRRIGESAFESCTALTTVTIPASVQTIDDYAFLNCYRLAEVYNLSTLSFTKGSNADGYIASHAYAIYTDAATPSRVWQTTDGYVFYEYGATCILLGYNGDDTVLTFPEDCHGESYAITRDAFRENNRITSVILSDRVTKIGLQAFVNCRNLASVTIGGSVTEIEAYAFSGCRNLTSVTFTMPTDWSAGETALLDADLRGSSTAATYLTDTYYSYTWTRQ